MDDASLYTLDANQGIEPGYPDGKSRRKDPAYTLGSSAKDTYTILSAANRQPVVDMGRAMADLTIPSVMPPLGYRVGDDLPGTNQSASARAVNNLASKIMFMAFPPGQPMMRFVPIETMFQKDIQQDPELYAQIELALSRVEISHRERAASIQLATAWVGYIKLLLVAGNALWKHINLECPTFHPLTQWVCSRDMNGHPILTIHEVIVRVETLPEDVQTLILAERPELEKVEAWARECTLYSVCRFKRAGSRGYEEGEWEYWEETEKGQVIEGSAVTVPYDQPPMFPGWCIPVYGQNYGRAYCEEYRGDLFILENGHSALNDGATMMSLSLMFVKPGGRTSLRQVQNARNLAMLSGSAEDISTFRSEKGGDMQFVLGNVDKAELRINQAFLVNSASFRDAERVTAEEVEKVGQELDQAMGGLYTEIAQSHQRVMVSRFIRLHEDSNELVPEVPSSLARIQVVTGVDAMGRSRELRDLSDFGKDINATFPPNSQAIQILDPFDYATRSASARGIKPDGLVMKKADVEAKKAQDQQKAQQMQIASKAAGPIAGPVAQAMASKMQQHGQPPQSPTSPTPPSPQGAQQ